MKIAIISDIHGNLEALKAVLEDTKRKGVEKIFCLGDIVAKGSHAKECIELVKQNCEIVVRGNCDRHFSEPLSEMTKKSEYERNRWEKIHSMLSEEEKEYLRNLPYSFEFYLSGSLVRIFHSSPEADNKVLISQDSIEDKYKMFLPSDKTMSDEIADVIIYGHIHHQYMDKIYNKTIANTGSVGNSFCLIRNPEKDSRIEEIRQANYCLLEGNYGEKEYNDSFSLQFVRVPYDINKELEKDYFEHEEFEHEVKNGTYRNMTKIKKYFENLGIDFDNF